MVAEGMGIIFPMTYEFLFSQGLLIVENSLSHSDTPQYGRTALDERSERRSDLYLTI